MSTEVMDDGISMHLDIEEEKNSALERQIIRDLMEEEESKLYDFQVDVNDKFFGGEEYKKLLNECGLKPDDTMSDLARKEEEESDSKPIIDFKQLSLKMTDISDGRKLIFKRLIRKGEGVKVPEGALAIYHYKFYHEFSTDPYDSTAVKGRPDRQRVGVGQVLTGLDLAIRSMCKKERSVFVLDCSVMFGDLGVPPRIPGKTDIYAEIEILDFTEKNLIDDFFEKSTEDRLAYSFEEMLQLVTQCRDDANAAFRNQRYGVSLNKYLRGMDILYAMPLDTDEHESIRMKHLCKFYLNMALTNLKLNRGAAACKCCNFVLAKNRHDVKALYRKARGLMIIGDYSDANKCLKVAHKLDPNNSDIIDAMRDNEELTSQYHQTEKALAQLMLNTTSKSSGETPSKPQATLDLKEYFTAEMATNLKNFVSSTERSMPLFKGLSNKEREVVKLLCETMHLDIVDSSEGIIIKKRNK